MLVRSRLNFSKDVSAHGDFVAIRFVQRHPSGVEYYVPKGPRTQIIGF